MTFISSWFIVAESNCVGAGIGITSRVQAMVAVLCATTCTRKLGGARGRALQVPSWTCVSRVRLLPDSIAVILEIVIDQNNN